jgi:hypothetical protein
MLQMARAAGLPVGPDGRPAQGTSNLTPTQLAQMASMSQFQQRFLHQQPRPNMQGMQGNVRPPQQGLAGMQGLGGPGGMGGINPALMAQMAAGRGMFQGGPEGMAGMPGMQSMVGGARPPMPSQMGMVGGQGQGGPTLGGNVNWQDFAS